ncbi:MAG TPA: tetratricopeptide repeat protein, partial [Kofleriaceae bacterium]
LRATDAYQKACDGGVLEACRNLGVMLRDGRGVPVDLARAGTLLDKACKARIPQACTAAGDLDAFRAIKGGNANYREMFAHYKQGCDAGDPTACRQLGVAYLEGKGLSKSPSAAAVWLERACMPDDPIACRMLGEMKLAGDGVARDAERARQLLRRACDNHDDEACRALKAAGEGEADDAGVGAGSGAGFGDGGVSPPTDATAARPPG